MLDFHPASPEEKSEAFAQVHSIWPHASDPAVHLVKRLHAVQQSRAEWFVGRSEQGVEVSCGAYPFTIFGPNEEIRPARAFGAVYTNPRSRGKGLAAKLLQYVRSYYQKNDVSDFILYSDIDAAFYEKLGFHRLRSNTVETKAKALAQNSTWTLESVPARMMNPGRLGYRYGICSGDDVLIWAMAKQESDLYLTEFSNAKTAKKRWALSTTADDSLVLLLSNFSNDEENEAEYFDLLAADAALRGKAFAKSWTSASISLNSPERKITERKTGILMWSSEQGEKDPWLKDIREKPFQSPALFQV